MRSPLLSPVTSNLQATTLSSRSIGDIIVATKTIINTAKDLSRNRQAYELV